MQGVLDKRGFVDCVFVPVLCMLIVFHSISSFVRVLNKCKVKLLADYMVCVYIVFNVCSCGTK